MGNNKAHALARDELIRVLTAYKGVTTSPGESDGTTLIDSNLRNNPSISKDAIPEKTVLIMSGDAIQEDKGAASFDNDTGKITLQGTGFSAQIVAGTTFRILNISSTEIDVARIEAKIDTIDGLVDILLVRLSAAKSSYLNELAPAHMPADLDTLLTRLSDYRAGLLNYLTELGAAHIPADIDTLKARLTAARAANLDYLTELAAAHIPADIDGIKTKLDAQKGATGVFYEQAAVAINESVDDTEHFVVTLTAANTRYILRDLRLKSADPTAANTITVKLYTLINGGEVNVDSFIITNANFGTYFTLMDMFSIPHVAGDSIRVSLTGSAAGPYVVTGQYSHAKTNV